MDQQNTARQWDSIFKGKPLNGQATFNSKSRKNLLFFDIVRPTSGSKPNTLKLRINGSRASEQDLLTGLNNQKLSDISLFISDNPSHKTERSTSKVGTETIHPIREDSINSNAQSRTMLDRLEDISMETDHLLDPQDCLF